MVKKKFSEVVEIMGDSDEYLVGKEKSLRNFKIVGDNVECWWVIIGVAVGCGDKKECRKFVEELQNYGGWASGDRDDRPEG